MPRHQEYLHCPVCRHTKLEAKWPDTYDVDESTFRESTKRVAGGDPRKGPLINWDHRELSRANAEYLRERLRTVLAALDELLD